MQEVLERTGDKSALAGDPVRHAQALMEEELIEESDERPAPDLDDARRAITANQTRPARPGAESERLETWFASSMPSGSGQKGVGVMKHVLNRRVAISLRLYRVLAAAFPYEFKNVYGDELVQLTEDAIEPIWRRHGVLGLATCCWISLSALWRARGRTVAGCPLWAAHARHFTGLHRRRVDLA